MTLDSFNIFTITVTPQSVLLENIIFGEIAQSFN